MEKALIHKRKRPKILHLCTVPKTLSFFVKHTAYFKSRGFDVAALSSPGKQLDAFAASQDVTVYQVKISRRITPLRDLLTLGRLWWHLRRIRPDVVHAFTPKAALLGITAAWLAGVGGRVYHMLGLPLVTARGPKRILLRWTERVTCRLSHRVWSISPSIHDIAIAEGLCPSEKINVLANGSSVGVDAVGRFNPRRLMTGAREQTRRAHGIPRDALVIGFVGRIVRDKGMLELVQAWSRLRNDFPSLHLLIAGQFESQDPVAPAVEQVLREDDRIHLAGYVDNMPSFFSAIDLLAFPTYREGFGQVSLESAAMELPVVTTRTSGCVDAVQDGVTGTLVPVRDARALADAIEQYLNDPELRRRHGQAGRQRVLRDFQPEVIWEAMYQEYVRLLEEKGLPVPEPSVAPSVEKKAA